MKCQALTRVYSQLYSVYKSSFVYKQPISYLYYRFWIAPKIWRYKGSLEKPVTHPELSVHMLTSRKDAILAAWSLASFYAVSNIIGKLTLHNDGTMTERQIKQFRRLFPSIRIVSVSDFLDRHGDELSAYPILKKFREEYPKFQSKKLLDVYFESEGEIILYLDSDMLWYANPVELEKGIQEGVHTYSHMMSNGVGKEVYVTKRDGSQISQKVAECNSGVTLFRKENYDLQKVSDYVDSFDYMDLSNRLTDQACFGTVLPNVKILPRDKYFIKGEISDTTIMRHYTSPSREKFYFYGLNFIYKKILG